MYAIDTRSHGQSDKVKELHYGDIAEDVKCFIEELDLENSILYGFSDGGIVGLLLAIKYPNLLSKVIGSGVNVNPDGLVKGLQTIFPMQNFGFLAEKSMEVILYIVKELRM